MADDFRYRELTWGMAYDAAQARAAAHGVDFGLGMEPYDDSPETRPTRRAA